MYIAGYKAELITIKHCKNNPSLVISVASYKHPVRIKKFPFTLTINSLLVGNN